MPARADEEDLNSTELVLFRMKSSVDWGGLGRLVITFLEISLISLCFGSSSKIEG